MEERFFYRYDAVITQHGIEITLKTFKAIRETKCYFMVRAHTVNQYGFECLYGRERRVPKYAGRCRAISHNKDDALFSFKRRQEMRLQHAERNRQVAQRCVDWLGSDGRAPDKAINIGHTQATVPPSHDYEW
ncbi:hypothetical protein HA48_14700 [Pantoea wallisii]|uniref:Uncharacterized protein n=1 Tax=Pantoea wallisii TaxID=1076551 RepID=A0A1X1D6T5_9GAMM|nr:hypothetical protein HA48_14700 [Pantoea wallisii]